MVADDTPSAGNRIPRSRARPTVDSAVLSERGFNCTVIIPVHNRPSTIRRAVMSALQQIPTPQVIVVDDGSDDDTMEKLVDLRDQLVCVRSDNRAGPGAARNLGARSARGDWLLFLDSDDLLLPGAIREFECLVDEKTVSVAMAVASFSDDPDGPTSSHLAGSFVVRKVDFELHGGYDEELKYGENTDLLQRLLGSGLPLGPKVARSATSVLLVTRRTNPRIHYENRLIAIAHLLSTRPDYVTRAQVARMNGIGAVMATRLGSRRIATQHAFSALRAEPWRVRHYARLGLVLAWPIAQSRWGPGQTPIDSEHSPGLTT